MISLQGCTSSTVTPEITSFHVLVTDSSSAPLSGAKVVSESQPPGQSKITGLTDTSGQVTFDDIEEGDYRLTISRFDYNQVEVAITITPENNEITVKMTPVSTTTTSPPTTPLPVTFDDLTGHPDAYNSRYVTVEGFYFSGFEISALASALAPASYNPGNVTPVPPLIWINGSLGQAVYDSLQTQTVTPSGYPEHFGRVRVTGQFQYGSKYGHLDAYSYQLTVTSAEYLPL